MQHFAKLSLKSVLLCVFSVFFIHDAFSQAQFSTTVPYTYTQNFNTLASTSATATTPITWTNNTTITGWYSNRPTYLVGSGGSNSGGLHSLGTASASPPERALGSVGSGSVATIHNGVLLANNTGQNLSALTITYKGEQWRSSTTTQNKLTFSYKLAATTITETGFTNVTNLDFMGATPVTTNGALDGNANAITITYNLPISIPIGQTIMLRWTDIDETGNDAALAIDDLSVTAVPVTPTITANPTTIPPFNYTLGNGPSTSNSYNLSGSNLSPTSDTIRIKSTSNYEISSTAATVSGFADSLKIYYTTGTLPSTQIQVRLKAGLPIGTYNTDSIKHSGGGVTTPIFVKLSGSVTAVPPPVITTTGTLSTFNTVIGTPSASQSYTVSGVDLVSDIIITAPTDFEIKTGAGSYGNSINLTPSSGSVPTTTIDVRLKATNTGTFSGNISHASTNVSPDINVAINGVVGADCGTSTDIAVVRAALPAVNSSTVTVGAIVSGTVTGIFGANKFYLQDATGGIAVFTTDITTSLGLAIGDQVKITGTSGRRNGEAQISAVTCSTKISAGVALSPVVFDANNPPSGVDLNSFLSNNEGKLGKIISVNIPSSGTFSAGTLGLNYSITTCNAQGVSEIRVDPGSGTLIGSTIPTVTQDITGIVGRFISADGGTNKLQIFPRNASDLLNSASPCTVSSGCGVTTFTDSPTQLDVVSWNIEWLGHPSNGPTNKALQQTNAQTVLNSTGADVYVLQEICQYNAANPSDNTTSFGKLVEGLNTTFGANTYSGECSAAVSGSNPDPNPQRVCIVYKNSVVTKVFSRPMFDGFTPSTYPPTSTPSQFWASGRKPFLFMAKVNINAQQDTILLVGLHAKAGSTLEDYNRRKFDVRAMYDTLQAQYPTRKTIVIGDLNDDVDRSIASNTTNGQLVSSYAPFLYVNPDETAINGTRPNARWNPISKALSDIFCASTASFSDYIDHQIISNEMSGTSGTGFKYVPASITSLRPVVSNYATTTSDHYPTIARFQYMVSTITSTTTGNWSSPSTWNCNCIPTSADNVVIESGHTVTVDAASQAKSLNLKGTLNYVSAFTLSLGM